LAAGDGRLAQWHRTVHVNLESVFGPVNHALAGVKRLPLHIGSDGRSRIVLVSFAVGQRGAFHCDYAATKGP
jgi:NAD(P)-dependent dehydrogenase (short-subunit alcohol dehydrogenase family)